MEDAPALKCRCFLKQVPLGRQTLAEHPGLLSGLLMAEWPAGSSCGLSGRQDLLVA